MIAVLLLLSPRAEACSVSWPEVVIFPGNGSAVAESPTLLVFFAAFEWSEKNTHVELFDGAGAPVPIVVRWLADVADVRPRDRLHVGESYQLVVWPRTVESYGSASLGVRASQVHVVATDQPVAAAPALTGKMTRTQAYSAGDCGWISSGVAAPVESGQPVTAFAVWDRSNADVSTPPDWWALGDGHGFYVGGNLDLLGRGAPYGVVTVRSLGVDGRLSEGAEFSMPGVQ